jgi:hypothetical protein
MKKMVLKRCPTCNGIGKIGWIFKKICPTCHGFGKLDRPTATPQPPRVYATVPKTVVEERKVDEHDDGNALVTGIILGSMLMGQSEPADTPPPVEGHGGEFGGGGATSEWDDKPVEVESSSESESSSDSDSSDSGGGDSVGGE